MRPLDLPETSIQPLWIPLSAGLVLALCLSALALPNWGFGAASISRTLFVSTFVLWLLPLTLLQRRWWRQAMPLARMAWRLLLITLAMTISMRALVMLALHINRNGAEPFELIVLVRGIEAPWLALIAYCAMHAVLLYVGELRRAQVLQYQAQTLARDAQLKALRVQLQPHFLFNTLNAISTLVGQQRNGDAQAMIALLAELLRTTLTAQSSHESQLAEEIALAEAYLAIEKVRLGERLILKWLIGPNLLPVQVPRLLLQPLLENAIRHGIALRHQPGRLTIRIAAQPPELHIDIDNELPESAPRKRAVDGEAIGLANIQQRLSALYPAQHQFRAELGPDDCFHVHICLPLKYQPEPL